jgi:hypothetical protein
MDIVTVSITDPAVEIQCTEGRMRNPAGSGEKQIPLFFRHYE